MLPNHKMSYIESLKYLKKYFGSITTYGTDIRRLYYAGRHGITLSEVIKFFKNSVNPTAYVYRGGNVPSMSFTINMDIEADYISDLMPEQLVKKARKNKKRLSLEEEQDLLQKAKKYGKASCLIQYCYYVIHGRWPEAEKIILTTKSGLWNKPNQRPIGIYAKNIVRGAWKEAETYLLRHGDIYDILDYDGAVSSDLIERFAKTREIDRNALGHMLTRIIEKHIASNKEVGYRQLDQCLFKLESILSTQKTLTVDIIGDVDNIVAFLISNKKFTERSRVVETFIQKYDLKLSFKRYIEQFAEFGEIEKLNTADPFEFAIFNKIIADVF